MRSSIELASPQNGSIACDEDRGRDFLPSADHEPVPSGRSSAVSTRAVSTRRPGIFSSILLDAARGAREYVERWVAGRGAE